MTPRLQDHGSFSGQCSSLSPSPSPVSSTRKQLQSSATPVLVQFKQPLHLELSLPKNACESERGYLDKLSEEELKDWVWQHHRAEIWDCLQISRLSKSSTGSVPCGRYPAKDTPPSSPYADSTDCLPHTHFQVGPAELAAKQQQQKQQEADELTSLALPANLSEPPSRKPSQSTPWPSCPFFQKQQEEEAKANGPPGQPLPHENELRAEITLEGMQSKDSTNSRSRSSRRMSRSSRSSSTATTSSSTRASTRSSNCMDCSMHHRHEKELELYKKRWELMDRVASATQNFLLNEKSKVVYNCLLDGILELMESEYGFIGEVRVDESNPLKTKEIRLHATTTVDHASEASKLFFEKHGTNFAFTNLTTLIGSVYTTKAPVISNNVKRDQVVGCPYGHPNIENFLGLPLYGKRAKRMGDDSVDTNSDDDDIQVIGILCIANKKGGYSMSDVKYVEPFTATGSNLIQAYWQLEQNNRLINDLEDKVHERTRKLELANKSLEEANEKVCQTAQQQLQMFACMSHEIRTPLNCIIGMSDILQGTDLTPMQNDSLKMITGSGNLLLSVVNDVLDFSKLASGNVEVDLKSSNLQETLDSTVHSIDMKAQTQFLTLRTIYDPALPEYITADSHRLQQVLFNLLGNAVKFSKQGGIIEFSARVVTVYQKEERQLPLVGDLPEEAGTLRKTAGLFGSNNSLCPFQLDNETETFRYKTATGAGSCPHLASLADVHSPITAAEPKRCIRIVVKDYGQGIKEEELENIFKPFRQESKYIERQHGGTGLGLSITAKLVEAMGGEIYVNSRVGEWTEFAVDLPYPEEPVRPRDLGRKLGDTQIILVDSDMNSYQRLKTVFEECGISCLARPSMDGLDRLKFSKSRIVCLIHEDFYDAEEYESLLQAHSKTHLVTFGPAYAVKEACAHIRTPTALLPCVLVNTICTALPMPETSAETPASPGKQISEEVAISKVRLCDITALRVLVAEDNHINQKVMARMLERLGVKSVTMVENGQLAVDAASKTDFDVILMDMQMPVMDGIQACRIITGNQHSKKSKVKIVFVSANVACDDQFSSAGAWDSVSKPCKIDNIRQCLHRVAAAKERE